MAFQKPLKVFLSYSHEDQELCRKFRTHLKSLVDDGIVTLWHDGMLRAGDRWDDEIKSKVDGCDLFLALTSAAFNDSSYIGEVELRRALERHRANQCLLIPVYLKAWRVPAELRQFQFLPDLKQSLEKAPDIEEAFRQVVVGIEEAIDSPAPAPATAAAPRREPPRDLPYLCNWTDAIMELQAFAAGRGAQRLPCVLITLATHEDGPEAFVSRILRSHLPKYLGHRQAVQNAPLDWPVTRRSGQCNFDGRVHLSLDAADPRKPAAKKLPEGLTILQAAMSGDSFDEDQAELLREYLHYWRKWSPLPPGRGLVGLVSVVCSDRTRMNGELIRRIVAESAGDQVRTAVADLPVILQQHAADWPKIKEVREYYRNDCEQALTDDIRELFAAVGSMPMKKLAPKLLELVQRYR